jgi:preprotein translocase subunit SecE
MSEEKSAAAPKKANLVQFAQEVRAEARKVTWATSGEVRTSSIMTFVMVIIAAGFFYLADVILQLGVGGLLSLASNLGK